MKFFIDKIKFLIVVFFCLSFQVNSEEISKLPNGVYYLDIGLNGNKVRKKIIKAGRY